MYRTHTCVYVYTVDFLNNIYVKLESHVAHVYTHVSFFHTRNKRQWHSFVLTYARTRTFHGFVILATHKQIHRYVYVYVEKVARNEKKKEEKRNNATHTGPRTQSPATHHLKKFQTNTSTVHLLIPTKVLIHFADTIFFLFFVFFSFLFFFFRNHNNNNVSRHYLPRHCHFFPPFRQFSFVNRFVQDTPTFPRTHPTENCKNY